jgi:TolB-like protein
VPSQRTIALLGFKNMGGDKSADWISSAVSSLLATELQKGDDVHVTPAEDAQRARKDLKLPNTDAFGNETLAQIRDRLGSNAVIVGSYLPSGDQLTLIVVVQDLALGTTKRFEVKGVSTELPALAAQAGAKIREALRISSVELAKQQFAVLPKNGEAARAFVEGSEALQRFDYRTAKDRLTFATQKEPDFAPAYIALADANVGLFDAEGGRSAARKAIETAKALDIDQQLLVTGQAYERLGQPAQAREQYRRLFASRPTLDYGVALLRVESPDDLPVTLASVRKLGADPRIDLVEAQAELDKSNAPHALELAQAAGKAAAGSGKQLIQAEAGKTEGEAQLVLGQLGAAADALDGARKLYDAAGDAIGRLAVMELIAGVGVERGDLDDAAAKYDTLADVRSRLGQRELAARAWAKAAYATAVRGRIADASKLLKRAEEQAGKDPLAIAHVDLAAAWIAWATGDADEAIRRSEQCAAHATSDGQRTQCYELNGSVRADRADPLARKTLEDALDRAEQATNPQQLRIDALQLALASLDLDDGQEASAIGRVETVQLDAQKRGATSLEAYAWVVLARAHLGQAESQKSLADLEHIKTAPQPLRLRVQYKLVEGLTHSSLGDPDAARERILAAKAEAEKQTCPGLLLEARLALAQTLAGDEAKAELEAVVRDAKERNFGRIVKLAETLSQP